MTSLQRLLLLLVCSWLAVHAQGLPLSSFFSYGPSAGDRALPRTNGASSPAVQLSVPFRLYGTAYSTVYINANGVITFNGPSPTNLPEAVFPNGTASVAPFWTAVDQESQTVKGYIHYRVTNDSSIAVNFTNIVRDAFGSNYDEFVATQMIIVTWEKVKGVGTEVKNTFQCVLASNSLHSYVFFIYSDGRMRWPGSPYALVGLNAGDGVHHLTIPTSRSEAVLNIAQTSNSRGSNMWVFRTDANDIIQPGAIVGLDQSSYELSESDNSLPVCVILYDGVLATDVELTVSSRRGGTGEIIDFFTATHQVTFSTSGSDSTRHEHCLTFDIVDDDILEDDETYEIHIDLRSDDVPVTILPHTTLVTILDDDSVAIEPLSSVQTVEEGGSTRVCFKVVGTSEIDVTYFFTLSPGTALEGEDYETTGANRNLVVRAGESNPCFTVSIVNDNLFKTNRRFYYSLGSNHDHVTVQGPTRGSVEIVDNDEKAVRIGFEHGEYYVMEGESIEACLWMTGSQVGQPFSVIVFTGQTSTIDPLVVAEIDTDFRRVRQNLTFSPTDTLRTKKCITIETIEDSVYEGVEQYGLHIILDYQFTQVNSPARLYIRENDEIDVTVTDSVYNVDEAQYVNICGEHTGAIEGALPFRLALTAGTATISGEHSDIDPLSVGSFYFDRYHSRRCASIFVLSDSTFEEEFESFTVNLVATANDPDPEHVHLVNASAEVVIRDRDVVRIKFEDRRSMAYENQRLTHVVNPCVRIQGHSSVDIPILLSYSGGNATDGQDYDLIGGDISFNANRNQQEATDCRGLTVRVRDDPVVEAREQMKIQLVSPQPHRIQVDSFFNSEPVTSIIIVDDDMAHVSFVAQLLNVSEGAGGVDVCLKMRGFSEISLSANIATVQDTAIAGVDFLPQSVQLTFPPTNQSILDDLYQLPVAEQMNAPLPESPPQCSRVAILDDDVLEGVQLKHLRLNLTMGGPYVQFESPRSVLVTIADDDAVTMEVTESEVVVNEGDRVARVCARMIGMADFPIRGTFTALDVSAESPDDYNSDSRQIEFPAHSNSPQCAEFPLVDDDIVEFRETFTVVLSASTRHNRVKIGENSTVDVTIEDNDFVTIGFELADFSIVESAGQVTVCSQLNGVLSVPVTVYLDAQAELGSATAGVDFTPINATIFSNLGIQRDCVDIAILDDSVLEDTESFEVAMSSPDDLVRFSRPTANVYVLDDDGVRMGLMEREYSAFEGEEIEICVELVGMISNNISADVQTRPGSARADVDYETFSRSFTFQPVTTNVQKICHNLTLLDDVLLEDEESLTVTMDVDHHGVSIHINQADVIIINDDEVTLTLRSSRSVVPEDVGQVAVCVDLEGSTEKTIEYSVVLQPGTAQDLQDYRLVSSGIFSFPPSTNPSRSQCYNIDILDDAIYESTEQLSVNLSTIVSGVNLITTLMQIEIEDNDGVVVGFNGTEFAVVEELQSGGVSFTACTVLMGRIEKNVVVRLFSEPISSNVNEDDYTALDELLTFEPSDGEEQSICRPVFVHDDREVEGAEFIRLRLTSDDPVVVLEPDSATVTITEGDVICVGEAWDSSRGFFEWPDTYPSEMARIPCKEGGVATRLCSVTGRWQEPILSNCRVSAAKLFKYLMMHPFSEENFAELLYAVRLLEDSKDPDLFKLEYMMVVTSYFEQFSAKIATENKTITTELLEIALSIIDGVQEWPARIVHMYSSKFVVHTESIISAYVAATNTTLFEHGLKHSSFFFEKGDLKAVLPDDKPKTIQYTKSDVSGNYVREPAESLKVDGFKSSITLPASLGTVLSANDSNVVGVFFSTYESGIMFPIADGNGARVNETNVSSIISATVLGQTVRDLKDNITYTINLGDAAQNVSGVQCVSWDFNAVDGRGNWTSKGCSNKTDGSGGNVTCSCNHLTNFAVLMDVRPKPVKAPLRVEVESTLSVISIIGVAVSVLGLLLTIITLLAFKKLRHRDSTVLRVQFCISVILMLISFVAGVRQVELFEVCVTVSALIHYFTLVSLMWMAAEALLMFQKAIFSTIINYKYFFIVSLICWLLPIPAVIIPVGLDRNYVTHDQFCFISHSIVFYAAFLGPIAAILVFDLLIFLMVICVVIRHSSVRYKNTQKHSKRKGIMLTMLNIIVVLVLFGLTWLFGAFTVHEGLLAVGNTEVFEFLFVVCNSLQGFYIFIFFVVLAKETRELWLETCGCRKKKEELPDADMESIPGTPSISRVPSLRRPVKQFNIDEYGRRLEQLTVDTPDTRKRMNSWDIMFVMPQNQFHILYSGNHEPEQHFEQHQHEEDFKKEIDLAEDGGELGLDHDNRSTADSGIMDDKAKSTPSPTMARVRDLDLAHPQPGGTPHHHVHSVSGVGYISDDEPAEDGTGPEDLSFPFKLARSHDIELGGQSSSRHSLDVIETSKV